MLKIKWKDVRSKWMEDERPRGVLGSLEGSRLTMGVGETRHGRLPTTPNCSPPLFCICLHLEEEHWLLRIDGCTVDMSHCTSCTELITRCTSHYALSSSHFAHFWPTHICKLQTNSFLKLLNVLLFTLMSHQWWPSRCTSLVTNEMSYASWQSVHTTTQWTCRTCLQQLACHTLPCSIDICQSARFDVSA